jgi:ketosteroid isomerase-like protein
VDHFGTRRKLLCAVADPTKVRPRPERRLLQGLRPHRHHRSMTREEHPMSNENAELIRRAYQAYASGDLDGMLELADPDLEWTYLDPALERPTLQVCHGRQELEQVLRHWAEHGLRVELEEVTSAGELVMVGVRTPGIDAHHGRRGDDRAYSVFTVREGRIVALRDCRDRQEALQVAGVQP